MNKPDVKLIKSKIKSLKIPRDYFGIDLDSFFEYQWSIYMSIREVAGKSTQALTLGLVLNSLYPDKYIIEYLRNDNSQIVKGNIESLFDTIIKLGYIKKIYGGKWNSVEYKSMTHKFFLCNRDDDGNIIDRDNEPICVVHSLEKAYDFKSSYVSPRGNYIVLDEFQDTGRATYQLFPQLLNAVSTIGRPLSPGRTEWLHILLIGNNTNEFCWYFDDFNISDEIPYLKYGGSITFNTEYNTTGICKLLELGETQKKRLADKNIPFLGFPGKKAAAFTGASEWSGKQYRHIDFDLDYEAVAFRRFYIYHRKRYIQLDLFNDDIRGRYVFAHFASAPLYDDNIICTLEPEKKREIYGLGKYVKNDRILKVCRLYVGTLNENRVYYQSNRVGALIDDFIKNIK